MLILRPEKWLNQPQLTTSNKSNEPGIFFFSFSEFRFSEFVCFDVVGAWLIVVDWFWLLLVKSSLSELTLVWPWVSFLIFFVSAWWSSDVWSVCDIFLFSDFGCSTLFPCGGGGAEALARVEWPMSWWSWALRDVSLLSSHFFDESSQSWVAFKHEIIKY